MKTKQLYLAALAHSFGGQDSERPVRTALYRLAGLAACAAGLGWLVGKSMDGLVLAAVPQAFLLVCAAAFAMQIAAAFALLVAVGMLRAGQAETFVQLLLTWPLTKRTRWLLFMLPSLVLAALAGLMIGWPLYLLLSKLGLAWPLIAAGCAVGYASAFGLVRGLPPKINKLLIVWVAGVAGLEYWLLSHVNNIALPFSVRAWYAVALLAICAGLIGLFVHSSASLRALVTARERGGSVHHILPLSWWFGIKMLRRPGVRLSFGVALLMSLGIAVASARYGFNDTEALSLFAAILAASFATDLRALARRMNPAEITALKATARFTAAYATWAIIGGLAVTVPIVVSMAVSGIEWSWGLGVHVGLQMLIGALAGVFAGTLIIPEGRDISSQFMSTVLVLGILFALPQVPFIAGMSAGERTILDIAFCLVLLTSIFGIEQNRNPYLWRKRHAQ